ncbi:MULTISPECIES: class I SAM-dependent methyltransferase family protein [Pseudanabaena]|uniref:Methyltransferase domain-containing protein n=2 Tax=Pseudanabaena TaxID=1152 RepID=L8N0R3_9CYAN|nr:MULTISPECIES: class I SAM-dependent methyltransferase family protein [Pseudanabaena]ELS33777.1 hypothetical protein Pse7429DRAFT_1012 [Pseudanabaena biceps PCC 7429]MDG3493999.1 class I SAM-dependent methyltransferase family protein [Pseudanabaena catenata USMAC16]
MLQKSSPTYEQLLHPLPIWNPKAWYYGLMNFSLQTIGKLSNGIQIGFQYGFDSGVMLEYVYHNRPSGFTLLGKLIDWFYLNSQGWRGIRCRSLLMKATLREVLQSYLPKNIPCHLLDVACGGGRYDLEVLQEFSSAAIAATLRDYKIENVAKARQLADQFGVKVQIEQADAFSDADLERVQPKPNVVIVSGLHEILPNDGLIEHHFQQLYRTLDTNGTLVFTIQPQHPQLEMIARTLPAHTGLPWVMRVRSWELIHHWARAAGFQDFQVQMEPNGIFGVVTAKKNPLTL